MVFNNFRIFQLTLLKGNAAELLLLCIVWQAICTTHPPQESQTTIPTSQPQPLQTPTVFHQLNEAFLNCIKNGDPCCSEDSKVTSLLRGIAFTIYRPLLELGLGETEFISLKAIVFLGS